MDICIVDDVPENATFIQRVLASYEPKAFTEPEQALKHIEKNPPDILIVDQKMPGMTGIELIAKTRAIHTDTICIVVSAYTEREDLIAAVNSNHVFRYLVKPFSVEELRSVVTSARISVEQRRTKAELASQVAIQNRMMGEEYDRLTAGGQPILDLFAGGDPSMLRIRETARVYALSGEPVLVTGETGTGKELLARLIHHLSPRRDGPFVAVNCSNFNEHLMESTLFGHKKGAFTGANHDAPGLVANADGGTLFLDEIGDLPQQLQPKLLRFIQFQTFTAVGSTRERKVDVRLISASNRELQSMTSTGVFRSDLYFRLNALQLHLPALRERPGDIVPIMRRLAAAQAIELPPVSHDARELLESHSFPGNVRELRNIVQRLALMMRQTAIATVGAETLRLAMSHDPVQRTDGGLTVPIPSPGERIDIHKTVAVLERDLIRTVLQQENGNISRTASRLGLSRQGLRNKLRNEDEDDITVLLHEERD